MITTRRKNSSETILDAAEALVRESGVNRMTLDAVAARAGLSKGGLLYRFPSKDALLRAMIERYTDRLEIDGDGPPAARAVANRLAMLSEKRENRRTGQGMLAAIAENPDLLEPVRRANRRLWEAIKAGEANPDRAFLAWLAAEGLAFLDMFETSPLSEDEWTRIEAAIRDLASP